MPGTRYLRKLLAAVLGTVAFALVFVITDYPGPGLDPDALAYLGAGESVAHRGTYTIPTSTWMNADSTSGLAHFPPGFPTALAIPIRLGLSPTESARFIEAASAFVTVAVIVLLVSATASPLSAVFLALGLFSMTSMHEVHVSVLSEPLYLACMMLTIGALFWRPDQPWRAGLAASIALMTRYVGASLIGVVVLWTLTRRGLSWAQRIRRSLVAIAPAIVLEVIWMARTRALAAEGAEEIRKFAIYGGLPGTFRQGMSTVLWWLLPDPHAWDDPMPHHRTLGAFVAIAVFALAAIGYWWLRSNGWKKEAVLAEDVRARNASALTLLRLVGLVMGAHLGMVILSRTFADPDIPFDERILSPALLLAMIALALTLTAWWRNTGLVVTRVGVAIGLLAWWLQGATATLGEARYALQWGSDLAGVQWRTSPLLQWARENATRTKTYSNWTSASYFYLHRPVRELPRRPDDATLRAFGDTLRARHAIVLMFNTEDPEFTTRAAMLRIPGIATIARVGDGVVLSVPATGR